MPENGEAKLVNVVVPREFVPAPELAPRTPRPRFGTLPRVASGSLLVLALMVALVSIAVSYAGSSRSPSWSRVEALIGWAAPALPAHYNENGYVFEPKAHALTSEHFYATWNRGDASERVARIVLVYAESAYARLAGGGYKPLAVNKQFNNRVPIIFAVWPTLRGQAMDGYAPPLAFNEDKHEWRSGILINTKTAPKDLRRVVAHEVFHVEQFSYLSTNKWSRLWNNSSGNWFLESSANWFSYSASSKERARGLGDLMGKSRHLSLLPSASPAKEYDPQPSSSSYFAWALLSAYPGANANAREKQIMQTCFSDLRCKKITPQGMLERATGNSDLENIFVRGLKQLPLQNLMPTPSNTASALPAYSWEYYWVSAGQNINDSLVTCPVANAVGACGHGHAAAGITNLLVINPGAQQQPVVAQPAWPPAVNR